MSTPIPGHLSLWHYSHSYALPTKIVDPIKPLTPVLIKAFQEVYDSVHAANPNPQLTQTLENAFDESFAGMPCSFTQVREWVHDFVHNKTSTHPFETQLALELHSLIYELYIKKHFSVSFADFCSRTKCLQKLLILEKNEGVLHLLGHMIASKKLPINTKVPFVLAEEARGCSETTDPEMTKKIIKMIDNFKDLAHNQIAQKVKLDAYVVLFLTASKKERHRSLINLLDRVESMLKDGVLTEDLFAIALSRCVNFIPHDLEHPYIFRLIKILNPMLVSPIPNPVSDLLLSALTSLSTSQVDEFWKQQQVFENLWLASRKKKQFSYLLCHLLAKDMTRLDKLSAAVISEIIKMILMEKDEECPRKYVALVSPCIAKLEILDPQRLKNTLALTSTDCKRVAACKPVEQEYKMSLLQCAENLKDSNEREIFHNTVNKLISDENYAEVPLQLIWALALISSKNPAVVNNANLLWKSHAKYLSTKLKPLFGRIFIRHLAVIDVKSAIKTLESLAGLELPSEKWFEILKAVLDHYKTDEANQTPEVLKQLANIAKKILEKQNEEKSKLNLSLDDLNSIHFIFSELFKQKEKCLEDAKELWRVIFKYSKPETPYFSRTLLQPFDKNKTLLFDLMMEDTFYGNLSTALMLLTHTKPVSAVCWKKMFEKLKDAGDRNLRVKAWNVFTHFIENKQELHGSTREIAESCLYIIKFILTKHPAFVDQILEKESHLASLFIEGNPEASACARTIMESLLEENKETCNNDQIEKLLKFRTFVMDKCISPDWPEFNLRLATRLSISFTTQWQIIAFKMMVELREETKAAEILASLLASEHSNEDLKQLSLSVLNFLKSLPPEQNGLILKILHSPHCAEVLKQTPEESMGMLYAWNKSMSQSNYALIFIKLGFGLIPHLEASTSLPWVKNFVEYLNHQSSLPHKSDLKQLIHTKHKILVEILDKKGESEELFRLWKAFQRLSIHIAPDSSEVEAYGRMLLELTKTTKDFVELQTFFLWLKDFTKKSCSSNWIAIHFNLIQGLIDQNNTPESKKLTDDLIDIINMSKLSINDLKPVSSEVCSLLLLKAADTKDIQKMKAVWEVFWDLFTQKKLLDPEKSFNCWNIILTSFCPKLPNVYLNILSKIEIVLKIFENQPLSAQQVKLIEQLFSNSLISQTDFKSDQGKKIMLAWTEAIKILEANMLFSEVSKRILPAKSALYVIEGDSIQSQWGVSNLCFSESNENTLIESQWLLKIFSSNISNESKNKILKEHFSKFHTHLCQWLKSQKKMPEEVNVLYSQIFKEDWMDINNLALLLPTIHLHPNLYLFELAIICILKKLKNQSLLTPENKATLIAMLDRLLTEAYVYEYVFSLNFYFECVQKPTLDLAILNNNKVARRISLELTSLLSRIFKLNYQNWGKQQTKESIISLAAFHKTCLPFLCKLRAHREAFMKNMYDPIAILAGIDSDAACDMMKDFQQLFEELFVNDLETLNSIRLSVLNLLCSFDYVSGESFFAISEGLSKYFNRMIKQNKIGPVRDSFDKYMFGFSSLTDPNVSMSAWSLNTLNIKPLLAEAVENEAFSNNYEELFQYCLIYDAPYKKIIQKLTKEQIQKSFHKMVDRIGDSPSQIRLMLLYKLAIGGERDVILPTETLYCWKKALHMAVTYKNVNKNQSSTLSFTGILNGIVNSPIHLEPNKSSELESISYAICEEAFDTICNPTAAIYAGKEKKLYNEMSIQASKWLRTFWDNNCLNKNPNLYYKLLDKFIDFCKSVEGDEKSISLYFNSQVETMIKFIRSSSVQADDLADLVASKWGEMVDARICPLSLEQISELSKRFKL